MKRIIAIVLIIVAGSANVKAQTFDEIFRQKKTQRKYLTKQIAALKVYLNYLKEGYRISKKGLAIVGDITDGNLSDHSTYFESLSIVNQSLAGASLQQRMLVYKATINQDFNNLFKDTQIVEALTSSEIKYVNAVRNNLMEDCDDAASWLNELSADEKLLMRDDERIVELRKVEGEMKTKYAFAKSFINSTKLLAKQRVKEKADLERTEALLNSNY